MLCIITFNANSQVNDTINNSVGDELILGYKQHSAGVGIMAMGGMSMFVGSVMYKDNNNPIFMVIGGFVSLVGSAIALNSWRHFEKAGLLMNESGVGVKIIL